MYFECTFFGKTSLGENIEQITLNNDNNVSVSVINYGATLSSLRTPDSNGHIDNVMLGFNKLIDYEDEQSYIGATVGRCANRIAKGQFKLEGKNYKLKTNNGPNHLHGGLKGFDKKVWSFKTHKGVDECSVTMNTHSPDMEEGYPGNLLVEVTFSLNNKNELIIDYSAKTDKKTIVNLTNHSYWNLTGAGSGKIHDHSIYINANQYLPVDETLIPTGDIMPVTETPFYFLNEKRIGDKIDEVNGYDHCYVLNHPSNEKSMIHASTVFSKKTGRRMEVFTDQPGIQFYTGNFLEKVKTSNGEINQQEAFCLETQNFPDAINQENFPSPILTPNDTYKTKTIYKFSLEKE